MLKVLDGFFLFFFSSSFFFFFSILSKAGLAFSGFHGKVYMQFQQYVGLLFPDLSLYLHMP